MPSSSENQANNPSEYLASISSTMSNDITGLTKDISYTPSENNTNLFSPAALIFDQATGLSNGYSSAVSGITDFTAYNDYIHYGPVGGIIGTLNTVTGSTTRINVFNNLVKATARFEIYSRQYR